MILHRDEARPAVQVGGVQRLGELPRIHARRADVPRFAGFHDVVQRFQGLFNRRLVVPAVNLVEVDVVGAQRRSEASMLSMMCLRDRPL